MAVSLLWRKTWLYPTATATCDLGADHSSSLSFSLLICNMRITAVLAS